MILLAVIAIGVISLRLLSRSQPDKKKDAAKK
jgi:hypothetical protein